jgi:carbon monoxide dehydrogenase subunit G
VKVKVAPILAQFKGQASFVSRDDENFRASLKAEGRDTGGKGNASATITAALKPIDANSAKCTVDTQLNISGKVAQFGRGALADVSDKLLLQFVDNLDALIASLPAGGAPAAQAAPSEPAPAPAPTVRKIEQTQEVAPLDLLDTAGSTIAKRVVPAVLVVFIAVVAVVLLFR